MSNNFTETELSHEQWKDIDGYDGMYQVSDLGRVRSRYSGEWRVMKAIKRRDGYLSVDLWKNGKKKNFLIHRLVAQAFIENNDETKIYINHIDECKQNNHFWNLEYCTAQYNNTYNDLQFRKKNSKRRKIEKLYDPELSIDDNIDIFKENGIECCGATVTELRKDLGLTNNKRDKLKDLYDPDLSIKQNIELFRANGIDCCEWTVWRLRKDLGLTRKNKFRNELKDLYNPELSINENIKVFKENGISCSRSTVLRLRKDLGLIK